MKSAFVILSNVVVVLEKILPTVYSNVHKVQMNPMSLVEILSLML